MSLFFAKGCRRSRRWQILCIYTDNELKAVLVRGPGDLRFLCMKKYWKRMKKLLKKGGEWFTMEASGKKVVRSGTLWRLMESYV